MASRKSSAGERVLEGRHVIGLFLLMLLFSGVFFTLGYEMGRNQLEGQVRAAGTHGSDSLLPTKPEPVPSAKAGKANVSTPAKTEADPATESEAVPQPGEWEFYKAGEKKNSNDHLKPAQSSPVAAQPKAMAAAAKTPAHPVDVASASVKGSYILQVAALRTQADAASIAADLHRKHFPAYVQTPQGDKYYRVQVGPYADQKAMQAAKKGLEAAGFKAIIKH
jgi:septal ring-binding cell division protein DamX